MRAELTWPRRLEVVVGVARGLLYLHEDAHTPIIHRDIKASNVLLDADLVPKVADFGFAKLIPEGVSHLTTRVKGTLGYLAPEYAMWGKVSESCDVYSFGMLLLKILEHASNHDADAAPESSRQWFPMAAWTRYEAGELMELVVSTIHQDPRCRELAEMMIKVAFWCAQQRPSERPSMSAVVKMLEGEMDIALPVNPTLRNLMVDVPSKNLWMTMTSSVNTASASAEDGISRGSNEIVSL